MSEIVKEAHLPGGFTLSLRYGDLTEEPVDAIVNAANQHLQHGGGLAGAIVRKGGPSIQRESDEEGFTPTGTAAITSAGNLPARYVIHAVGPIWSNHDEAAAECLLASATEAALEMAVARGLQSIALPAISAGIYGFPKDRCASLMIGAILKFVSEEAGERLKDIRIVLMDREALQAFEVAWDERLTALSN